jgi:hypothetical protein
MREVHEYIGAPHSRSSPKTQKVGDALCLPEKNQQNTRENDPNVFFDYIAKRQQIDLASFAKVEGQL